MPSWFPHIDSSVVLDGLKSLLWLVSLLIARALLVRWILKNAALSMEAKRRWVVTVQNSMVFVFLVGLLVIWAHELEAFAVSLVALAAALVLATKELILCWSRAALRVGGKIYSVGDRIQIAGHRGVVLDHDVFATKLFEMGPGQCAHLYTGRITVFPNSLLLSNPLVKENPSQTYGLYTIVIPVKAEENWQQAEQRLLDAAKAECAPYMADVVRGLKQLEQTICSKPRRPSLGLPSSSLNRVSSISCCGFRRRIGAVRDSSRRSCAGIWPRYDGPVGLARYDRPVVDRSFKDMGG